MNDPRLEPLLHTAVSRLLASMAQAIDKTGTQLGMLALAASNNAERQVLMDAEYDLQRRGQAVNQAFGRELAERLAQDLQRHAPATAVLADTDWGSLRLVDDEELDQTVSAARLSRLLEVDCEGELRELRGYFATLQDTEADEDVFPLRPAVVAKALLRAVHQGSADPKVRQQVSRVLALHTAAALKEGYSQLLQSCQDMRVTKAPLAVRKPSASTTSSPALGAEPSIPGALDSGRGAPSGKMPLRSAEENLGQMFGIPCPEPLDLAFRELPSTEGAPPSQGGAPGDSSMLGLMRRLQSLATFTAPTFTSSTSEAVGLEPVNVIRAHRDELLQASGGAALDQMVIDIVATLFDQVLSDPKVPPQMARQIARLQLPVLRVALRDQSFFHSRKHPVRRLINRMATLASAFEELDDGPGAECIEMVGRLVKEIVEGDFDRMDIYEAQLKQLEQFVQQQAAHAAQDNAAVTALLSGKEADLRVQQRYMQLVQQELADLEVPTFIKTFLSQIWTQVQVMVSTVHGHDSELSQRMKRAGRQLVLSVQPKGSTALRQEFLRHLPQLMKDLNDGLDMIQWPAPAKQEFFGQLLPMHAQTLKAPPPHELSLRLLDQRLRKVEQIAIPSRADAANDPLPSTTDPIPLATHLSPQEAQEAGWVSEASLAEDSTSLDIDLSAGDDTDISTADIDILLDSPSPPSAGPTLVNYIQPGAAYRMLLKGHWRKVRLTWVSEGRTFFIFAHGHHKTQETISLTARTLTQMCAGGRFKAFEQAQLLERATIRARRQLAALSAQRKVAA
ncbi:MAG TPA: DUF1631 family protein [Aquabacterium sp.]|uniref:DUF1631 family protein n=1 Tax=Aquabacterium sp. TaxID=1872578 RepID=UPI002E309960|nr:DUF1631 family protein [Aquabacterium sp.]HEX5372760.1 DUF1631 family protein [Aquabacterium sp.]